jgi:hypothetical protein
LVLLQKYITMHSPMNVKKGLQSSLIHGPTLFQLITCGRCVVQNYTTTRSFTIWKLWALWRTMMYPPLAFFCRPLMVIFKYGIDTIRLSIWGDFEKLLVKNGWLTICVINKIFWIMWLMLSYRWGTLWWNEVGSWRRTAY